MWLLGEVGDGSWVLPAVSWSFTAKRPGKSDAYDTGQVKTANLPYVGRRMRPLDGRFGEFCGIRPL